MKKFFKNVFYYLKSYPYSEVKVFYEVTFRNDYDTVVTVFVTKKRFVKDYKDFPDFKCKRRVIWKIYY